MRTGCSLLELTKLDCECAHTAGEERSESLPQLRPYKLSNEVRGLRTMEGIGSL